MYIARSLAFSKRLTNSNIARSLNRTSTFVPLLRPPPGVGLISKDRKLEENVGCSNLVNKMECNGTDSESKYSLEPDTNMN